MTLLSFAVAGAAVHATLDRRGIRRPALASMAVVAGLANPVAGAGLGIAWIALRRRRAEAARRAAAAAIDVDQTLLVHMLLVALSGGLSLASALATAGAILSSGLGGAIDRVLREAATAGLGPALQSADGPGARLFRQLGSAHASGAPLVISLTTYASELHETRRATALQRARQLPVKMVVPLTLLMLPGFVLLTVGPTVLTAFSHLLQPLTGP